MYKINKSRIVFIQLFVLVIFIAFFACDNSKFVFPKSTFDSTFPKKNKDLTSFLGSKLILKVDNDTMRLKIVDLGKVNMITADDKTGDTLFYGTVSKYRGLYYFSQKINDTCFWIFAVKEFANKIYGLNGMFSEQLQLERSALSGKYPKLIKYINKDTSIIRLYADKKSIRKILKPFVDTMKPCTIINFEGTNDLLQREMDTSKLTATVDSDEFEIIKKVYPNPSSDFVNVELQEDVPMPYAGNFHIDYMLYDILAKKKVKEGGFTDHVNKIDVSNLPAGVYILRVYNPFGTKIWDSERMESVKLIKQ